VLIWSSEAIAAMALMLLLTDVTTVTISPNYFSGRPADAGTDLPCRVVL
jgi:hypothetical protein